MEGQSLAPSIRNPVRIEMNDLAAESESLANFLQKHLKLTSSLSQDWLVVDAAEVSTYDLLKMVKKFINSKGLNSTHWVDMRGNNIKMQRFNHKKEKKNKHPTTASTIKHGW
jgi:hypothetical protein